MAYVAVVFALALAYRSVVTTDDAPVRIRLSIDVEDLITVVWLQDRALISFHWRQASRDVNSHAGLSSR